MPTKVSNDMRRIALVAALVCFVTPFAAPRAQQDTPATPPKPLVPVAASSLASKPDAYYGEYVTLMGAVEASLSPTVFSVDQDKTKTTGHEVLILVSKLYRPVDVNTYVTAIGEVTRFEPDNLAEKMKDAKLDLAPDVIEKYRGKPVVLAMSVINAGGIDLTKRLPPPMTSEEEAYSKIMKQVGPANAALRKALEAMDVKLATENAAVLKQAFTQTAKFWKSKRKGDATTWAQDARKLAETIDRAATGGKWDEVKASTGSLGQKCQSCHGAYRDRFDDGSFRIKGAEKGASVAASLR